MILELIGELFLEVFLYLPGTALRYIFLHKKYSFKELLNQDTIWNFVLSILFFVVLAILIGWLNS